MPPEEWHKDNNKTLSLLWANEKLNSYDNHVFKTSS